jgi:exodeoxyribonuclease V alpha subunit
MTIHKSQGSQAREVTVLLPDADSLLLTRELLYTAVTRARGVVRLIGSEESLRTALARRAHRASGLQRRLAGSLASAAETARTGLPPVEGQP